MSQQSHSVAGDVATDIAAGLDEGCYLAQVRSDANTYGVLYATAEAAPSDSDDWFQAPGQTFFTFQVGDDTLPTWVMAAYPGVEVPVSIASME